MTGLKPEEERAMTLNRRTVTSMLMATAALAAVGAASPAFAQSGATWDKVAKTGVLSVGLIPNRPPYQFEVDGKQEGLAIQMGEDLAAALSKELGKDIAIHYETSSWSTLVLDIQSGRIDTFFGMSETPERRAALDMFGPLYSVPVVAITAGGTLKGKTWDALNTPETRVSVVMGTTDEDAVRKYMSNATIRAMKSMAEAILDVQSGNSDALVTSVLLGINAMDKNANFTEMTLLEPPYALPSGGGARKDGDGRFTAFVQKWSEAYRASGRVQQVILESLKQAGFGIEAIPAEVKF
jgi:polar amino acid transport system substrate-binding protein